MKFILTIILVLIFCYLFYLIYKRTLILSSINNQNNLTSEGFDIMTPAQLKTAQSTDTLNSIKIIKNLIITKPTQIKSSSLSSTTSNYPLHQLCIKGCYNSAYTGSSMTSYGYISIEMLKYVLCRGCRYLDFQVYYLNDTNLNKEVFVGFNNNNNSSNPLQINKVNVKLYDMLEAVIINGFLNSASGKNLGLSYSVPNVNDPIFIQIRTHPKSSDKLLLMNAIQTTIQNLRNTYSIYFTKINLNSFAEGASESKNDVNTYLKDILQKIIFIFEYDIDLYNQDRTFYKKYMQDFTILYLDNGYFRKRLYSELNKTYYQAYSPKLVQLPDATGSMQPMVNTKEIVVVCPNNDGNTPPNVNIFSSIRDYGYNINLIQYYVPDTSTSQIIQRNEDLFDSFGFSIVPLHSAIMYCSYK